MQGRWAKVSGTEVGVKCGACGEGHESVADVRTCYGLAACPAGQRSAMRSVQPQRSQASARRTGQSRKRRKRSRRTSTEPSSDSTEIRKGAWKGRSGRAISDAELMKKLKDKYPKAF